MIHHTLDKAKIEIEFLLCPAAFGGVRLTCVFTKEES